MGFEWKDHLGNGYFSFMASPVQPFHRGIVPRAFCSQSGLTWTAAEWQLASIRANLSTHCRAGLPCVNALKRLQHLLEPVHSFTQNDWFNSPDSFNVTREALIY